jgi:hypothetical protein
MAPKGAVVFATIGRSDWSALSGRAVDMIVRPDPAEQAGPATPMVMRPCPLRSWFAPLAKPALAQRARA